MIPRRTTAAEIRDDMLAHGLDISGVDFEKLAETSNDESTLVPGWSPPPPPTSEWRLHDSGIDCARYVNSRRRFIAMVSCTIEKDGRAWLHVSCSHADRIPTHGEVKVIKQEFLGDRYAYAVWPPKAKYVNLAATVLHLFALLDENAEQPLPDFTQGTGSI